MEQFSELDEKGIMKTSEEEIRDRIFRIQSLLRQVYNSPMKTREANTKSRNINTIESKALSTLKREAMEM